VRGNANEIEVYTPEWFHKNDAAHRTALHMSGATYCVINWDDDDDGVGVPGDAADKPLVPPEKCMELLERAISATYGTNLARIHAMRGQTTLFPGSGRTMHGRDAHELAQETRDLLLRTSGGHV